MVDGCCPRNGPAGKLNRAGPLCFCQQYFTGEKIHVEYEPFCNSSRLTVEEKGSAIKGPFMERRSEVKLNRMNVVFVTFSVLMVGRFSNVTAEGSTPIIELEQSVHFFAPSGDDVLVEAGEYEVEAAEE